MLVRLTLLSNTLYICYRLLISRKLSPVKVFCRVFEVIHLCLPVISQEITHLPLLPHSPYVVILLPQLLAHRTAHLQLLTTLCLSLDDSRNTRIVLPKDDSPSIIIDPA